MAKRWWWVDLIDFWRTCWAAGIMRTFFQTAPGLLWDRWTRR